MNKEALEKRLTELRKFMEQIVGAITECEYWLRQLENGEDSQSSPATETQQL